ncbi:MAG: SpoIIE family protein phosphatase, partial [Gaiellaceae bacterium]
ATVERISGAAVATLQIGQPAVGALQLFFGENEAPSSETLARLTTFGVRAAQALRASAHAQTIGSELERTRALLEVVAQANAQRSLEQTLATVVDRVGQLLGAERVAVYLREDGRLVPADARALDGPHTPIAERLLALALGPFRGRGMLQIEDAAADVRLAGLEEELAETGIEAAVAAPLLVLDDVTGLLALYPPRGRSLTGNEWTLLAALVSQLAVAVQNARLLDQATTLGAELERALDSERQRAKQQHALYEISRSFAQSLSLERTLDALASTIVELLEVDAAVIRMPDGRGEQLVPRALHVADARLGEAIRSILVRPQPLEQLGRRLFRRGRPLVLDPQTAGRLGAYRLLVPFLKKGSTAVVLPIATPTELLGTLSLVSLDPERPITTGTTEIALSVAAQAALALDNARLYQQQKEFSDAMQRSLLPRTKPELPGLELGDVYESSARVDVGGDVYDYLTLEDGRLAVVLGDVTGHGIDAAADMAMAKFVFRSLAREHPDPGDFLAAANEVVCGEIAPGKFITMLYLTIDPALGELACASAGHPAPLIVQPDGAVQPIEAQGLVLGIESGQAYAETRATLPPGAAVVLFTDGVIEARRGGELYGRERLEHLLATERELPAGPLAEAVLRDCRSFSGGELADDCAVVVIKRTRE